jgi:transcription elongation GreA/GreB family factor
MSKAFTREDDQDDTVDLPEREVSSFPNLVTPEGLAAIDVEIARYSSAHAAALAASDKGAAARAARELRYWTQRRATARIAPPPEDETQVRFGATVTLQREDGRKSTWRIVGEDEADPATGTLSHASPLARALMGREAGDSVAAGATEAEIISISR